MVTCYLLTGDIGGTNSRMSLYAADSECDKNSQPLCVKYYRNTQELPEEQRKEPTIFQRNIITPFLKHCWDTIGDQLAPLHESEIIGCLATAGLVMNNAVRITNLGFVLVDGTAIERDHSNAYLRRITVCHVINDFVAQGYGCLTLTESEVKLLHGPSNVGLSHVVSANSGPKVCVGAGTGLGECYLTPDAEFAHEYTCFPSEGGHVEYAPRNDLEVKLLKYLMEKFSSRDRVSVERVVSGIGLANVYDFLAKEFPTKINPTIHTEFLQAGDEQGRVVGSNASTDPLCRQAMDIMMCAYGCEVGSAAIKWIPTSGLFVTGGLTPKNIQFIEGKDSFFMRSYLHKGRVSPVLDLIPLYAVMTEDLGVRGAHKAAKIFYEQHRGDSSNSKNTKKPSLFQRDSFLLGATVAVGFTAGMWFATMRR